MLEVHERAPPYDGAANEQPTPSIWLPPPFVGAARSRPVRSAPISARKRRHVHHVHAGDAGAAAKSYSEVGSALPVLHDAGEFSLVNVVSLRGLRSSSIWY